MLCTPHECPNQQTPQQNFQNYKTTPKNMTSIRSKNIYGINPAHQHPTQKKKGGTSALSQHPVSPIHIITTQHTNMLRLKRIEQSTLLSSQTTHHPRTPPHTHNRHAEAPQTVIIQSQPQHQQHPFRAPRRGDSYNYTHPHPPPQPNG